MLYKYCKDHEIPHKQIGKLIVATGLSEVPRLSALMTRGIQNGVEDLRMMEGYEATTLEPELQCVKALWSPSSGIVDSHSLMLSLVVMLLIIQSPNILCHVDCLLINIQRAYSLELWRKNSLYLEDFDLSLFVYLFRIIDVILTGL